MSSHGIGQCRPREHAQELSLTQVSSLKTSKTSKHLPVPCESPAPRKHLKQVWSGKGKVAQSCPTLCNPMDYSPQNSPGQNTGVGSLSLLQGLFPTQESNPGLPHWRRTLYQLTHKRSPRILEWAAYSFFSSSSWSRSQTGVSCTAGGFFTNWAIREATRK